MLILNLVPATHLKKVRTGDTGLCNAEKKKKKYLIEHLNNRTVTRLGIKR